MSSREKQRKDNILLKIRCVCIRQEKKAIKNISTADYKNISTLSGCVCLPFLLFLETLTLTLASNLKICLLRQLPIFFSTIYSGKSTRQTNTYQLFFPPPVFTEQVKISVYNFVLQWNLAFFMKEENG